MTRSADALVARAGFEARDLVRRVAVEVFGAVPIELPVEGSDLFTRRGLDEPLAGVRAARLVSDVAAGTLREWALTARGSGRSWHDVVGALELGEGEDGASAAEVAWVWLVEHRPPAPRESIRLEPPSAVWTCGSCRARVRDTGPFASHPTDREHGHSPGCARRGRHRGMARAPGRRARARRRLLRGGPMSCSGLHCGGCGSRGSGGGRLVALLLGAIIGLPMLYRGAEAALAGASASAATANRFVGAAVAVVLVVAAITASGWVLLARRRQLREAPQVAEFSARVQEALDARQAHAQGQVLPGPSPAPLRLARVTARRLDDGPTRREVGS